MTFNIVKDLFKGIEGLCRSDIILIGSNREVIFDLGGLRKKNCVRCQISRSKTSYMVFQHKSVLKLVKNLFN